MCLICTGCITQRGQQKSVAKPRDINLRSQEGCAGQTCTRREQPWMGTLQPCTHQQPSERVQCLPPPFFFFFSYLLPPPPHPRHHLWQRRPAAVISKEKGHYLSQNHANTEESPPPPGPQHAQTAPRCLMVLESVSVQYVLNFPLHQPSCNQLWITIVF